jgi:hypothetical protein
MLFVLLCALLASLLVLTLLLREVFILWTFLSFASINERALQARLACMSHQSAKAANAALQRHVFLRSACRVTTFPCWRRSVSDSSLRELWALARWCRSANDGTRGAVHGD